MNTGGENKGATARPPSAAPKRVAGGLVLRAKKKRKSAAPSNRGGASRASASTSSPAANRSGVPSILASAPAHEEVPCDEQSKSEHDEFDDADFDADDVPSDALMCLQTYTRSTNAGGMSETCAYCPIYTREGGDGDGSKDGGSSSSSGSSTHAAPFLPQHVLLHLLDSGSQSGNSTSSRTHAERDVKRLASSNRVRLLQLHGTADTASAGGNEDEDVAVMETSVYVTAAEMALRNHFHGQSAMPEHSHKADMACSWFKSALLPYFAGKRWVSSQALDAFLDDAVAESRRKQPSAKDSPVRYRYSMSQMKEMIQQLVQADILLPRRGARPGGGEGYWFSLPGLGRASKSMVDGRTSLLRRLKASQYKEKRRSALERDIGRIKQKDGGLGSARKDRLEQSGKFVVLDLLAKGWVEVRTNCTGEQFVRLVD